jgi:hypothetical protein
LTKNNKKDIVTSNYKEVIMDDNTTERQRAYKERLYKAGFKQMIVWVRRKEGKTPKEMNNAEFVKQLKKLTAGMSEGNITQLLNLLIKIAKGKKKEVKLKNKN